MAYESFYGGRQGASFVIVRRYSSIEEMLNDFKDGGITTQKVNYGEYVIIDTNDKNNKENGCVYRRGMNINAEGTDPIKDPGKGAEYIGQIVGPEGSIKNIEIDSYDPTAIGPDGGTGEYTPSIENNGLVPGSSNDAINYSQMNVKNAETGHIEKYLIGFQFPYFEQDQVTELISPYNLPQNLIEDITDITGHPNGRPFYREYKLKIPNGIKGDSVTNVAAVPVKISAGERLYNNADEETGALSNPDAPLTEDLVITFDSLVEYEKTKDKKYIGFKIDENTIKYAYLTSAKNDSWHSGFLITNYNESLDGESKQFDGGVNNYIADMVITDGSDPNFSNKNYLLVLYSDENLRNSIKSNKRVNTYKGIYGPQLNLGYVKGEPGTSPILGKVNFLDELYVYNYRAEQNMYVILKIGTTIYKQVNVSGELSDIDRELTSVLQLNFSNLIDYSITRENGYINQKEDNIDKYAYLSAIAIPPEKLMNNSNYEGQLVTYDIEGVSDEIYGYDYLNSNDQYKIGVFGGGSGNQFIIAAEKPTLDEGGVQGKTVVISHC